MKRFALAALVFALTAAFASANPVVNPRETTGNLNATVMLLVVLALLYEAIAVVVLLRVALPGVRASRLAFLTWFVVTATTFLIFLPALVFEADFPRDNVGALSTEMVRHFFHSLSQSLRAALHLKVTGENTHHMVEALFKGCGRALRPALQRQGSELPSTKGML